MKNYFDAMAEFRPAQEQAQHPGEEHLMQPVPKHHGSNYKAAGKLKVCNYRYKRFMFTD